jgi:hypothetical protein
MPYKDFLHDGLLPQTVVCAWILRGALHEIDRTATGNFVPTNQKNKWTPEEEERLKTLLEANTSIHLVAVKLKRSVAAVRNRAGRLKISRRRTRFELKVKGK